MAAISILSTAVLFSLRYTGGVGRAMDGVGSLLYSRGFDLIYFLGGFGAGLVISTVCFSLVVEAVSFYSIAYNCGLVGFGALEILL